MTSQAVRSTGTLSADTWTKYLCDGLVPNSDVLDATRKVSLIISNNTRTAEITEVARHLSDVVDGEIHLLLEAPPYGTDESPRPLSDLYDKRVSVRIFILGGPVALPSWLIKQLFSLHIAGVFSVSDDFTIAPYSRPPTGKERILFISPGSIYPLSLGSHQRMFKSALSLLEHGFDIDILHQAQRGKKDAAVQAALRMIAVDVRSYKAQRGKLKGSVLRRRNRYDRVCRLLGQEPLPVPATFSEVCQQRSSFWLHKEINSLAEDRSYSAFWVNYAWMMGKLPNHASNKIACIVCDTHDVQYHRNARPSGPRGVERLFLSEAFDKADELRQLRKAQVVIAISDRDAALLKTALPDRDVVTMVPTFAELKQPIRPASPQVPLRFGFIGTKMQANVDALLYVLKSWWPDIHRYMPDCTFRIAGSVSLHPEIETATWLFDSVERLGFVENLSGFYEDIDVLLSPVLVQGGLNFKNIEAVVAGKHVFTNSAGLQAMKPVPLPPLDTKEEMLRHLRRIEMDPAYDTKLRHDAQRAALNRFTNTYEMEKIACTIRGEAGDKR